MVEKEIKSDNIYKNSDYDSYGYYALELKQKNDNKSKKNNSEKLYGFTQSDKDNKNYDSIISISTNN